MIAFRELTVSDQLAAEILAELHTVTAPGDLCLQPILDEGLNGLDIERDGDSVTIRYSRPVFFYRALGLIGERAETSWHLSETARFASNGMMIDCSRNAVMTVDTVKKLIRQMALMGLDTLMLYTEDTYEVAGEPYFGYMRGRYTGDELRELDRYAAGFGVELVPCIQTLAHLNAALQWQVYGDITDIGDILLVDEPKTYAFVEKMIASCREVCRTRRIHIGMDEAHLLGRGTYYDKHGDSDRFSLMCRHLQKVAELCKKYDFEPMIWSDMFFRLANDGAYYGSNPVPAEAAAHIPEDVSLVYWDYYNEYDTYDRMLKAHRPLPGRTAFAGGAWKWTGYLPSIRNSINCTKAALTACVENGVEDVLITAWGDDGADASLFTVLPVFQAQAELGFYEDVDDARLAGRLKTCTGAVLSDFMLLDMADLPDGPKDVNHNPHKYLLFQDVLLGLFDRHVPEGIQAQYERTQERLAAAAHSTGSYRYLFETAAALMGALAVKAEIGVKLKAGYDGGDLDSLQNLAEDTIPLLIKQVEQFRDCLEKQWMTENKPFGFEVQDIRIGGLIQRLKSAKNRIGAYLNGRIDRIAELEEERLPFDPEKDGALVDINLWKHIVTASVL